MKGMVALSQKNEIIDWLENAEGKCYCDECLTKLLNIGSKQYTNVICNELMHRNEIRRKHGVCSYCGKKDIINSME